MSKLHWETYEGFQDTEGLGKEPYASAGYLSGQYYLRIAAGATVELEYHKLLAHDLGYLRLEVYNQLNHQINEVKQMLNGLLRTMRLQHQPKKLKANR